LLQQFAAAPKTMRSRKKVTRFSQKQRELDELANQQAHLSFFSKLTARVPTKVGGAVISALIVLHFVSQFIFFQNEIVLDEIALPKIENAQIVEIKPEYKPAQPDVVTMPESVARLPIAQHKAERLPRTVKKKQQRESKAERLRRTDRTERDFRAEEVASVFPYGRFLTRSATN
jgi:hypothetical protein